MAAKTSTTTHDARTTPRTASPGARFVAITFTGLGVVVIAACAVLLSYNGIYQIARQGGVDPRYAHLYPGGFTLLLLMTFWTSYVLRDAPRVRRLGVDSLILVLILLAACASALEPLGYALLPEVAVVVTAVAPWVALLFAFRIWLWMVMHLRGERAGKRPRRPRGRATIDHAAPDGATDANAATGPLGVEPSTTPDNDATAPMATAAAGTDGAATSEARETARSAPAQLWPRAGSRRSTTESSVRVLEADSEEADEDIIPFARPAAEDAPAATRATAPQRTTATETVTETAGETDTEAATPAPADDNQAAETDTAPTDPNPPHNTTPAPADDNQAAETDTAPTDSNPPHDTTDDTTPTLGEQLRRALLPEEGEEPVEAMTPPRAEDEPDDVPYRGDLPKRTPRAVHNQIKDAGEAPESPAIDTSAGTSASAPVDPAEEGFVHVLSPGDPTSDEGDPRGEWAPPTGPDSAGADSRLAKRPVALRPRRAPMAEFPADPPSGRVRSEPTPPEEPRE